MMDLSMPEMWIDRETSLCDEVLTGGCGDVDLIGAVAVIALLRGRRRFFSTELAKKARATYSFSLLSAFFSVKASVCSTNYEC